MAAAAAHNTAALGIDGCSTIYYIAMSANTKRLLLQLAAAKK